MALAASRPPDSAHTAADPRTTPETYKLGTSVSCEDGPCGELSRLVVDPFTRTVTHVIVEPRHRHARARLVPVTLLHVTDDAIQLHCTREAYLALQFAQETEFLPQDDLPEPEMAAPLPGVLSWPYYRPAGHTVRYERLPPGEIEIRRGQHVHASARSVGRVEGLIVDPVDRHITHVLLQHRELWHTRRVAIPITSITRLDGDGVHTDLTVQQLIALPDPDVIPVRPTDMRPPTG